MPTTERQRWARVLPRHASHEMSLRPGQWYRVLEREPYECIHAGPVDGYLWLEDDKHLRHVWAAHLEIREGDPAGGEWPTGY